VYTTTHTNTQSVRRPVKYSQVEKHCQCYSTEETWHAK